MLKTVAVLALVLAVLVVAGIGFIVFRLGTAEPEIMTPPDYETTVSAGGDVE